MPQHSGIPASALHFPVTADVRHTLSIAGFGIKSYLLFFKCSNMLRLAVMPSDEKGGRS